MSGWTRGEHHWVHIPSADGEAYDFRKLREGVRPLALDGDSWGDWIYSEPHRTLTNRVHGYEVGLDQIFDSHKLVDLLAQLIGTGWATAKCLGDFVLAVDHLVSSLRSLPARSLAAGSS